MRDHLSIEARTVADRRRLSQEHVAMIAAGPIIRCDDSVADLLPGRLVRGWR